MCVEPAASPPGLQPQRAAAQQLRFPALQTAPRPVTPLCSGHHSVGLRLLISVTQLQADLLLFLQPHLCCAVATILLAVLSLIDDKHRLRSERLQARASTAKGAVAWLAAQASQVGAAGWGLGWLRESLAPCWARCCVP